MCWRVLKSSFPPSEVWSSVGVTWWTLASASATVRLTGPSSTAWTRSALSPSLPSSTAAYLARSRTTLTSTLFLSIATACSSGDGGRWSSWEVRVRSCIALHLLSYSLVIYMHFISLPAALITMQDVISTSSYQHLRKATLSKPERYRYVHLAVVSDFMLIFFFSHSLVFWPLLSNLQFKMQELLSYAMKLGERHVCHDVIFLR